jgi:CheY-like chemotaxis protein
MRLTTINHQTRQPETRSATGPTIQSRGTILVVDDDSDVRLMTQIALENDGYAVITAANALEGLMLFAKHISAQFTHINSARVDAAVIDLKMPGMHGLELAAKLRNQTPNLPIVAISGYGQQDFDTHVCRSAASTFLPKPFRLADLRQQINSLLEDAMTKTTG